MKIQAIADTGPLVAYLSKCDTYHAWVCTQLEQVSLPLLTCEAVLTEACFLVSRNGGDAQDLVEMVNQGWLSVPFALSHESRSVSEMMRRYANVPMSFADACLLRMTELFPNSSLLTLDSDFSIYRKDGNKPVPVLMPDSLT